MTERAGRPTDTTGTSTSEAGGPEYGPAGYLPERAARRARKIVLRSPMGIQWPAAAAVAALVVGVLGVVFVLTRTGPPGPPFVPAAELAALAPGSVTTVEFDGADVLLLRAAGDVEALAPPAVQVTWCGDTRRLEAADGQVWTPAGRLVGGAGDSLRRHPLQIHDGTVYVDPQPAGAVPPAADADERPGCA